MLRRIAMVAGAALLIAAASWAFVAMGPASDEGPGSVPAAGLDVMGGAATLGEGGGSGMLSPAERVAFWEARIEAAESDGLAAGAIDLLHLTDAYLDRLRVSGDTTNLDRAAAALDRVDGRGVDSTAVEIRRALVALGNHDFEDANARAARILADQPDHPVALGIAGDANLEIGRVDLARDAYERLAAVAPSPPAWSREAKVAFLTGDLPGALALAQRALDEALTDESPEALAFYHFQLGEMQRLSGGSGARANFEAALAQVDDYVPALLSLAHVRAADGAFDDAARLVDRAAAFAPHPEVIGFLGELRELAGDTSAADALYRRADALRAEAVASGATLDRHWVIWAADHGRDIPAALAAAQAELELRTDVYGHDALAWTLFRAGRVVEARRAVDDALALGTPDARIALHAGLIAAAIGDTAAARDHLGMALTAPAAFTPRLVIEARSALATIEAP